MRFFNDRAVPGMGGVWFGKQLLLATLGVALAEKARSQGVKILNIAAANAVEALACLLAFRSNKWTRDYRLRGRMKLHGKNEDFHFRHIQQRNFYVTQPMRMATVQALPALGFVKSDSVRFNAFSCSEAGWNFIEQATKDYRPHNRAVIDQLIRWVHGKALQPTLPLEKALSPLVALPDGAKKLLRDRIIQGGDGTREGTKRRRNALAWVERLRGGETDDKKPKEISDAHWHDLRAGKQFLKVRNAAIALLDTMETYIGKQASGQFLSLKGEVPDVLVGGIDTLNSEAGLFLKMKHQDAEAGEFCRQCTKKSLDVLHALVERDGHVLRLVGNEVKPGPAFRGTQSHSTSDEGEDENSPPQGDTPLPEGFSERIRNLYLLSLDMDGTLDSWLRP
ncbi:MAG: hypothetical protein FWG59_00125, partial [Betaproteobacteria bacterium]|nr:hypothetical protein [Betaproteobacteria bacterium]